MSSTLTNLPVIDAASSFEAITPESEHCFFGYYDVSPWSADGRRLLVAAADFIDHSPENGDNLRLQVTELGVGRNGWRTFATSSTWNWQMGCRLQWLPGSSTKVLYNDLRGGAFRSVVHDLESGRESVLPMPVFALSRSGNSAVTLNFSRLHDMRPGYGYHGLRDEREDILAPEDDGIYVFDLAGGEPNLILSFAQIAAALPEPQHQQIKLWVNHLLWSPDDQRILVFARVYLPGDTCHTYFFTVNPDGSELTLLAHSNLISHFDWQEPGEILVYAEFPGYAPDYYFVDDPSGRIEPVAPGAFDGDGHCSLSPDGRWMLTDTYPDPITETYPLLLLHLASGKTYEVCRIKALSGVAPECRCDLHPRWKADGRQIAFDAAPAGIRQMFLCDISSIVDAE